MVYPVTLEQSMAVVIGQSLYFMAGLWDRMNEREVAMAGRAANLGEEFCLTSAKQQPQEG